MAQNPDEILQQYQASVDAAASAYQSAQQQLTYDQSQLDAIPEPTDISPGSPGEAAANQRKALQQRIDTETKVYSDAQQQYVTTLRQRADAVTKAKADADPAKQRQLDAQATADVARANQIDAEAKEFTSPEATQARRDQQKADTRLKTAQADTADAALALEKETDPIKKQAAQVALDQANANLERTKKETANLSTVTVNTDAEYIPDPENPGKFIKNPNYKSPSDKLTPGQQAVDTAAASTATDTAQANLRKAQADADLAEQNLLDAKRKLAQAPTDAQAQQAIQQELAAAQQRYDQAQFTLDQAKKASPIALAQGQANVESTQADTAKTKASVEAGRLGTLYGLQDRIKDIRDLIASGEIKPEDGTAMIAAEQRGTTVYDAMKQQSSDALTARGQTASNLGSLAGDFTSAFNSGFNTIADMNKYAKVGSSAGADAFLSLLNIAQDRLGQYKLPAITQPDYLGVGTPAGNLANAAADKLGAGTNPAPAANPLQSWGVPVTTPAPVSPTTGQSGGVTINISGGGTTGSTPTPAMPPIPQTASTAGGNPLTGVIGAASSAVPATPQDVIAAYPGAAQRHGLM